MGFNTDSTSLRYRGSAPRGFLPFATYTAPWFAQMAGGNATDTCAHDASGDDGLGEVLAGVAIAVVASVGINIGNNVQVPACLDPDASGLRAAGLAWGRGEGEGAAFEGSGLDRSAARPTRGLASGQSLHQLPRASPLSLRAHRACAGAGAEDAHRGKGQGGDGQQGRGLQA